MNPTATAMPTIFVGWLLVNGAWQKKAEGQDSSEVWRQLLSAGR